jgi:hypothetical protein
MTKPAFKELLKYQELLVFVSTSDAILLSNHKDGTYITNVSRTTNGIEGFGKVLSKRSLVVDYNPDEVLQALFSQDNQEVFDYFKQKSKQYHQDIYVEYSPEGVCCWISGNLFVEYDYLDGVFSVKFKDTQKTTFIKTLNEGKQLFDAFFEGESNIWHMNEREANLVQLIKRLSDKLLANKFTAGDLLNVKINGFDDEYISLENADVLITDVHSFKFKGVEYFLEVQSLGELSVSIYSYLQEIGADVSEFA